MRQTLPNFIIFGTCVSECVGLSVVEIVSCDNQALHFLVAYEPHCYCWLSLPILWMPSEILPVCPILTIELYFE